MSSWNIRFQRRLKKKKVIAGRPIPKLSELTELILKFSFDLENMSAVIHISKKCAKMSVFNVKIVKILWLVGVEQQVPKLRRPTGFSQIFCQILNAPLL